MTDEHRNRKETRVVKTYPFMIALSGVSKEWEEHIQELVLVERTIERFDTKAKEWKESYEESFYLSTRHCTVQEYGVIIR